MGENDHPWREALDAYLEQKYDWYGGKSLQPETEIASHSLQSQARSKCGNRILGAPDMTTEEPLEHLR